MRRISPVVLWALLGSATLIIVVGVLALLGVKIRGTDWSTFLPDLIVGFITAAVVGAILAAAQHHFESRRRYDEQVSAAYDRLLESVATLRQVRFNEAIDPLLLNTVSTRLIQLAELADREWPVMPIWFEAERQLALHQAVKAAQATEALVKAGNQYTADNLLSAGEPFYRWTADFGDNIRYWRTGKLTSAEMKEQSEQIEALLRKAGSWRDGHHWRTKKMPDTQ
jgi:hypothetical protein